MVRLQITDENRKRGRPLIGLMGKMLVVRKLEPYLKIGFSIRKACSEAKVNRAWVYTLRERDENFADQIDRAQQYLSVIVNNILTGEVVRIVKKQITGEELSKLDVDFLMWFGTHSNAASEEYGRREKMMNSYDPELEIHRIEQLIKSYSTPEPA